MVPTSMELPARGGAGDNVVVMAGLDLGQGHVASLRCWKSSGLSSGWGEPRLQSRESGAWEA